MREEEIARKLAERIAMEGTPRQAQGVHVAADRGGFAINGHGNVVYTGYPEGGRPAGPTAQERALTRLSLLAGLLVYVAIHAAFVYWHYDPQGGPLVTQLLFGGWPITGWYVLGSMLAAGAATLAAYLLLPGRWFRR